MYTFTYVHTPPGVRLGSVVAPTAEALARLKAKQVPWSVNCVALVRAAAWVWMPVAQACTDERVHEYVRVVLPRLGAA